ncbi:MAG: hypothetical protein KDH20_12220 [Rhodocyclaceae bacterium]|nr:hypothetical protein [Rhodocyclaceae bacterium]
MPAEEFSRDVSATLDELAKWVAAAYPDAERVGSGGYRIVTPEATLVLTASPGPERRIALLRLPTLSLRYHFTSGDEAARGRLLHRLDLFMHRGGG